MPPVQVPSDGGLKGNPVLTRGEAVACNRGRKPQGGFHIPRSRGSVWVFYFAGVFKKCVQEFFFFPYWSGP
jgi:hypothetical protein